jgi:phosphatidylglycerol---prolipoprotein diacylglyceryl transferase
MRPTLFYIPHELFGFPVFGFGWMLVLLIAGIASYMFAFRRSRPIGQAFSELGFVWLGAAAVIVFLLPRIETHIDDGTANGWTVGLPIRGYGVMLMLGVISAVSVAWYRCKKVGIEKEAFSSLATWVVVSGIVGARVFYVVQKWSELDGATLFEKLYTSLKFTEGGLVVYGSVIGALLAMLIWSRMNRTPLLCIADSVTPAFFIGLAFGRIGCLLNGCCYGGICEQQLPSIAFPSGSPAYMDQLQSGRLLGIETDQLATSESPQTIRRIDPKSWAADSKIEPGQVLNFVDGVAVEGISHERPLASPRFEAMVRVGNRRIQVPVSSMPDRALAVHPSQVYAAFSGLLLCIWTMLLAENWPKTGYVFGTGLVAYGAIRIIEEIIRVDEGGQFGTSLSIAQWISAGAILLGVVVLTRALGLRNETSKELG